MTKLKVWGRTNSINVQKVMWTIAELGLDYDRSDAGMSFGVVTEAWFGDLNPNRLVPVIDDAGTVLWESNVIVRYLAAKHATGTLMPTDPVTRAEAEMWMDWQQTTVAPAMLAPFLGLIRTPPEERDHAAIDAGTAATRKAFGTLEARLTGRDYILGSTFTVADIPLGCAAYRWFALDVEHGDVPNVRAWYDRLRQRPGYTTHVMLPVT